MSATATPGHVRSAAMNESADGDRTRGVSELAPFDKALIAYLYISPASAYPSSAIP